MADKKLFLLDAYALAYRSYYAFIKNPRINSKGENTSAVFGFANTLIELLKKHNPTHIGVVFDPKGLNFRHEMFKEYKANREAMPEDLRQSIPYIKELIEAFNIPVIELDGYEADDVIGTLANKTKDKGYQVYMMTPDKDYAQLVTEDVFVYKPGRSGNEAEIWDTDKVKEKFKVGPDKIIDLLGLMGDSSDNIPGCPGIGPKGAEKLIAKYGSIEGIYENIEDLKGKQKENLIEFKDQILLSKKLATIIVDAPIDLDEVRLTKEEADKEKIAELFTRLEFKTMINRVFETKQPKTNQPVQGSLFDEPVPETVQNTLETIDTVNPEYVLVKTKEEQNELVNNLQKYSEICFDTETTDLTIHSAKLVGFSFAVEKGKAWYVTVPDHEAETQTIVDRFKPVFENNKIKKIGQNLKYDILVLKNYGVEVKGELFDTMLAHYLIQPELRHNLDFLAEKYLDYQTIKTEELIGKKGKNQKSMRQVPLEKLTRYACEDADITLQLYPILKNDLVKQEMESLFENIELPLIHVLADMEYQGVRFDKDSLKDFAQKLKDQIMAIEKEIFSEAGMEFNISSPKQLGEVLFDRMKIISNPKKTKTKQYSTSEDVLVKLAEEHPIVNKILEYRSLRKLLNTYVEALPLLIHTKTNRIHTSYNQTITATGRLSSNNPNLQNIPIREERGREIRKAFVPSDDKHVLLAADYSQIELRLMAHLSGDENMVQAFVDKEDIHAATAARIFKTEIDQVTRDQRSNAKGANFGIIYGISAFGLAQNLNISRSDAKALIDGYFESYPKVKEYMDETIKTARDNGYAITMFGRRRYLSDIQSNNANVRSAAERNAINAPIQGAAADIIKKAMINVHKKLRHENLKTKMILQVHDELVFDVPKNELERVKKLVKDEMEGVVQLKVPLTVDMDAGENWLQAH